MPETACREESSVALTYVERFVTYCQENGIVPVLVYLPCQISEQWQLDCNAAIALGERLGAKTLNMQYMGLMDLSTDWYDNGSHLNPAGAMKATACMGDFLRQQCGLEDRRTEQGHDLSGSCIRQAEEGKVRRIDDLCPLVHVLAALGRDGQQLDLRACSQPVGDAQAGGAGGAVNEYFYAHAFFSSQAVSCAAASAIWFFTLASLGPP